MFKFVLVYWMGIDMYAIIQQAIQPFNKVCISQLKNRLLIKTD